METVVQSLLGIIVSLALSGCLVNLPPGVEMASEMDTSDDGAKTAELTVDLAVSEPSGMDLPQERSSDHAFDRSVTRERRCATLFC